MILCFNNEQTVYKKRYNQEAWCQCIFTDCNACTMITLFLLLHQLQHHSHHRFVLLHRHLLLSLLQLEPFPIQLETLLLDLGVLPLLLLQERNVRLCGRCCFPPLWCYRRFISTFFKLWWLTRGIISVAMLRSKSTLLHYLSSLFLYL